MKAPPRLALTLAVLALGACSKSNDEPSAAATPTPVLTTAAAPTVAADGTKLTVGQWNVGETAGGASAVFANDGAAPELVLVCDRNTKTLWLERPGDITAQTYRLEVAGLKADVKMAVADGMAKAQLDQTQPIFAAWSDPAATISVTAPVGVALKLPGDVGISRVIAACS